jgi:hypothetical protein
MNGSRAAAAAGRRGSGAGRRARTVMGVLSLAAAALLLAACSGASYAVRIAYLGKMSREGVQANHLLKGEEVAITRKQCVSSYFALHESPPDDQGDWNPPSAAWLGEIRLFYVQSCVTGLPKPVPGQAPPARTSTPAPSGSASG